MSENKVKEEKKLSAKIFSIVCTVLTVIIVALTCYVLISLVIAKTQNKPVSLFGSSFAIVQTNSMEPEIMTGDLIIFHICDISEVNESDNIVFIAGEGFDAVVRGQSVVHKAMTILPDGIVTQGVNNSVADKDLVTADNFLGICTYNSSFLGALFSFLTKYGILLLISVIAVPVIVTQAIKIVKLSKQSAAQKAESKAEEGTETIEDATDENHQ